MADHPTDAVHRPTTTQILTVVTLLPLGGLLLCLAGITLTATLIGLIIAVPLFVIFSPILVPAVVALALAVTGFITSGVFGITALSSVTWTINYFRRTKGTWAEQFDQVGRHVQDAAEHVGLTGGPKAQDVIRS